MPERDAPVVSVAMVVCNANRYLAAAIESILGQTFRDLRTPQSLSLP
jgi:hypothetical protein